MNAFEVSPVIEKFCAYFQPKPLKTASGVIVDNTSFVDGNMQDKIEVVLKTCFEVASISSNPYFAIAGGCLTVLQPALVRGVCEKVDSIVSPYWKTVPYDKRIVIIISGIVIASSGWDIVSIPASLYAFKVTSEQVLKKLIKDQYPEKEL